MVAASPIFCPHHVGANAPNTVEQHIMMGREGC